MKGANQNKPALPWLAPPQSLNPIFPPIEEENQMIGKSQINDRINVFCLYLHITFVLPLQ